MVDFRKQLARPAAKEPEDPVDIYERLDRASDKGPLRPAQRAVLEEWYSKRRRERDVILKLHTGQGKTLIGLLILQSKLNETGGPVVYLCPNRFLVQQTLDQATQFGIRCVTADDGLDVDFIDGKAILVATIHKMFNGLSQFGIGPKSMPVEAVVMDDAHSSIDVVKESCKIKLDSNQDAFREIVNLFAPDIERQGAGTFADIKQGSYSAFLPIPYWAWFDRYTEVVKILSKHCMIDSIKFAWPLIKDDIKNCLCIVSGQSLEIAPYLTPMYMFGSFYKARQRVFMSATMMDDSFLIKELELLENAVTEPLVYEAERWSGEKMVLIPSHIDASLSRSSMTSFFSKLSSKVKFGVVALCPSFRIANDWRNQGCVVAERKDIDARVEELRSDRYGITLVVANRYDGIDLPDNSCRILVLDSRPFAEGLVDRYVAHCRDGSDTIVAKTARIIEQGMGRSVRGERDYSVIVLIDPSLVSFVRAKNSRKFLSSLARTQIELGIEIGNMAMEEISTQSQALNVLVKLIRQCLGRDSGWKEFYAERMSGVSLSERAGDFLQVFSMELASEKEYGKEHCQKATEIIQELIDRHVTCDSDKGWYLQEMARYMYPTSKSKSNSLQITAHEKHPYLLKPKEGMRIAKVTSNGQKRVEMFIDWIKTFDSHEDLYLTIDALLSDLRFGVEADAFEKAFDDLAKYLGFIGQRPDKQYGEGPDNLWVLKDNLYLLAECKSEVDLNREEINRHETGQMNNASAWFKETYPGIAFKTIMIIPTRKLAHGAAFNDDVEIMRNRNLRFLMTNVRSFFDEFRQLDLHHLSNTQIQDFMNTHSLSVDDICTKYSEKPIRR